MRYSFLRFPNFKDKAVTLSYDDGVIYDEKLIEIMAKNGLKGTFNINSGILSKENTSRMTKEKAISVYKNSGNEVAVHGRQHLSLAEVDEALATKDVLLDRIELEKMFGTIITGMAYANGSYNDNVVEILKKCGIEYSRTTISTENFNIPDDWLRLPATCHHDNPRLMELANTFIEAEPSKYYWSNTPKLFYVWGHSYEFNNNNNWNVIEEFAEYIGNREDVWYATNGEICRYVKAFKSLKFSTTEDMVYNPSSIDVYLSYHQKPYIAKSGQITKLV